MEKIKNDDWDSQRLRKVVPAPVGGLPSSMTLDSVITETILIADPHASAVDLLDDVEGERPAGQIAREAFARLLAVHGESRVDPAQQRATELLREPLGAVQALEHAAAEDLLDELRVEVRELQAPSACTWEWKMAAYEPNVWIETTRPGVTSWRSDARDDRVAGRAGEQAEQAPLALEQSAQDARNREHEVTVRHGLEDLRDDMLREQRRALRLAARTEVASPAGERKQAT